MSESIEEKIRSLAAEAALTLDEKIVKRVAVMASDDDSHTLIYRVLGIDQEEGRLIDVYQNKGRFLYNAAGRFLEKATQLCFQDRFPDAKSERIPNTIGRRPKTFEIDCLVDDDAIEIKWRDATTDGDHIAKEHTRIQVIAKAGFIPVRVMFFYPNREQAMRIQQTLQTLYAGIGGQYYFGESAWVYVQERTSIDLKGILQKLAEENTR